MDNELSKTINSQRDSSMNVEVVDTLVTTNSKFNCRNNDIVLPDSIELDWAQISYAINYKRLLFISNYKTWLNFHTENSGNEFKYIDYSPEELSHRFLQRVLPNIYEYELTEDELHLISLLDLHPNYVRTESGFNAVEQTESITFPSNEPAIQTLYDINFAGDTACTNHQILISGPEQESSIYRKFIFSAENSALLSVALSSDEDLPNCELLTTEELYKRLKTAKSRFENSGHQLENINISVDDLVKKIKTLHKLKTAITELMDSSFRRQNAAI